MGDRKRKARRAVWGVLVAGWMTVIFLFSAQPSDESSKVSGTIAYTIVVKADEIFDMELGQEERIEYADRLDYPVRKAAHMTEYAILAVLSLQFFGSFSLRGRAPYGAALALSAAYAMTDEFHQLFIAGRSGMAGDVCIDTAGAAIGLLLAWAVVGKIAGKHCKKGWIPLE